jgi:hypothetical protein
MSFNLKSDFYNIDFYRYSCKKVKEMGEREKKSFPANSTRNNWSWKLLWKKMIKTKQNFFQENFFFLLFCFSLKVGLVFLLSKESIIFIWLQAEEISGVVSYLLF